MTYLCKLLTFVSVPRRCYGAELVFADHPHSAASAESPPRRTKPRGNLSTSRSRGSQIMRTIVLLSAVAAAAAFSPVAMRRPVLASPMRAACAAQPAQIPRLATAPRMAEAAAAPEVTATLCFRAAPPLPCTHSALKSAPATHPLRTRCASLCVASPCIVVPPSRPPLSTRSHRVRPGGRHHGEGGEPRGAGGRERRRPRRRGRAAQVRGGAVRIGS